MYMRKLNFNLTSSAENVTTFSLYKRKILNPPPYQNGCLLAFFACLNPLLNQFFSENFGLLTQKQGGGSYIGGGFIHETLLYRIYHNYYIIHIYHKYIIHIMLIRLYNFRIIDMYVFHN